MATAAAHRPRWAPALALAVLLAVALALRLIDLGDRPFHHDESQDAYFSWTERFEYDPLLHGPLRLYLTAAMYALFGASDFTARLAPALMGTMLVALPLLARRQIGHGAAWVAAILFAVGPSYLYFSRFAREDIYVACVTLGMLVVALRLLDAPRPAHPPILGALLAASFAIKETTFITGFVGATFLAGTLLWQGRGRAWRQTPLVRALLAPGPVAWAWGAAAFVVVYVVLFTVGFQHPRGLLALYDGLAYWLGQHDDQRGGEPRVFYAFLLWGMEWPVLALGAVGVFAVVKAPTMGRVLLVWGFVCSLLVYSEAGEKFAWLVLHPLLPLVLLAGIGAQFLWAARDRWAARAALALALVGVAYTAWASYATNALHRADPRELLVSTQSSEDVLGVRDEVLALSENRDRPLLITVDAADGASYPWAWYFRDLRAGYLDMTLETATVGAADVLILTDAARERLLPELAAYEGRRFFLRVWWIKDYGEALSPVTWGKYWVTRKPWNPTGGMGEWLYVRRDVRTAASRPLGE